MMKSTAFLTVASLGTVAAAACLPAQAQSTAQDNVIDAPVYGSATSAGPLTTTNFNTPEADGRPGVKFFTLAVQAFRKKDYAHAIDMYKVAASWAYKPAEYNLGVMYFKGQGVPADRPLGTAWMVLAAERGNPQYVKAQNLMISLLTDTQFAKTDTLWGKLKKTYGDKVALHRAKVRWAWVKTHQTGTRVGGATGELRVGVRNTGHIPGTLDARGKPMNTTTTAGGMLQGGSVDGSVAYRQFRLSDNPYSPIFLKNRTGSVVVDPLVQIHKNDKTKHTSSTKNSDQPQNPTD